jgi:plasmid stability protein
MAQPLKRVNLMLDEGLVKRLRREAKKHHVSMSELARTIFGRELGPHGSPEVALVRLRQLRASIGPMAESAEIVRKDRDRGW